MEAESSAAGARLYRGKFFSLETLKCIYGTGLWGRFNSILVIKKRHSMSKGIIIWLEFKDNILTPTVLISNELFIKQEGEESQVLICVDFT